MILDVGGNTTHLTRLQRYELALMLIACVPGGDRRSMETAAMVLSDKFNIEALRQEHEDLAAHSARLAALSAN